MSATTRARRRRLDGTLILTVVLPMVVVLALALTRPEAPRIVSARPSHAPLSSATVVCPGALDGRSGASASLTTASVGGSGASGTLTAQVSGQPPVTPVEGDGRLTTVTGAEAATKVTATGDLAPGLLASLTSASPLTAWDCMPPVGDQWFTGVGAGPTQASVVELVNPNTGPAVADLTVLSDEGAIDVPQLRGIAVKPGATVQLDLGQLVPRTGVMALHLSVVRGQVGAAVRDRGERLTGGTSTEDWLPPQAAPARHNLLLGLQPGSGRHTLTLANDGDSQVSAELKLVTADATFAPDGLEPVEVPPHSVVRTVLDDTLGSALAKDAVGLEVEATGPVTTSLRSVVGGDLSFLVPGSAVADTTSLLVPAGPKRLVLGGAGGVGVATVVARDAAGTEVVRQRVAVAPDRGPSLDLPSTARVVDVTPERTAVQGAVLLTGGGSAVLRLRSLERSGAVPAVAFGP